MLIHFTLHVCQFSFRNNRGRSNFVFCSYFNLFGAANSVMDDTQNTVVMAHKFDHLGIIYSVAVAIAV